MRIAVYARVSTDDKGQDPENQLRQLRQWCASAGHELVHEYGDHESGRKGTKDRRQFAALFEDAHKRKFDCVLFWALDRFTREGMVPTILHLQRLASMMRHGCGYALANAGHDTRALQAWLGHKNIQHTVRYTELAPDRFKNFWRD